MKINIEESTRKEIIKKVAFGIVVKEMGLFIEVDVVSRALTINICNHYQLFLFPTASPNFVHILSIFLGGHDVSPKIF